MLLSHSREAPKTQHSAFSTMKVTLNKKYFTFGDRVKSRKNKLPSQMLWRVLNESLKKTIDRCSVSLKVEGMNIQ